MHPIILPPAMGEILGKKGLFNLILETGVEGKP